MPASTERPPQQLGDLLSRGWGHRHGGYSTALILTRPRNFYGAAGAIKKLRSRGGFQSPFPLTHMNRHNNKHAGKTKKPNLRKEKPMQTKQSVINSNIRATVIAAFGVLLMVLAVSETAQAQANQPTPLVFQAAGPDATSIQGAVDAFRASLGDNNAQ